METTDSQDTKSADDEASQLEVEKLEGYFLIIFINLKHLKKLILDQTDDDESAEESEFVPSCWDQSLQPSKSSLKSPEKESSGEVRSEFFQKKIVIKNFMPQHQHQQIKQRRRVAFKIQRYHSVYEYPSEVVQLSPAYSEPQLWSNYDYSGNIDFFTYTNPLAELADTLGGFSISSSSRPFANTHNIHNTWPNETTDFSWSQYQVSFCILAKTD